MVCPVAFVLNGNKVKWELLLERYKAHMFAYEEFFWIILRPSQVHHQINKDVQKEAKRAAILLHCCAPAADVQRCTISGFRSCESTSCLEISGFLYAWVPR